MDYNLFYNIAALLLLLVLSINMGIKNNISNTLYRIMLVMMSLLLLMIASLCIYIYIPKWYPNMNISFIQIYMILYYISALTIIFFTCTYVIMVFENKLKKNCILHFLLGIYMAGLFSFLINIQKDDVNKNMSILHKGHVLMFEYGIICCMYLIAFSFVVINRKLIQRREKTALYLILIIQFACGFLQEYFRELLILNLGYSISMLAACTGIKNMEEVIDSTTQAYTKQAFYRDYSKRLRKTSKKGKSFDVVTLFLKNIEDDVQLIGMKYEDEILQKCSYFLKRNIKKANIYYLGDNTFTLLFLKDNDRVDMKDIAIMENRFMKPWQIGKYSIMLDMVLLILNNINYSNVSVEDIGEYINYARIKMRTSNKDIYRKEDLDIDEVRKAYNTMLILKKAIINKGFDVVYQPIYSAEDNKIVSAEALVRLKDEQMLGYISPEEFIPIAEKGGMILDIGEIVLNKVCCFIHNKQKELIECGIKYIEVNLSTIQCMEHELDKKAIDIMNKYDVAPSWINFEITETAEINSIEYVKRNIQELKKSEISFSLDDYGSGNANINYLLELPFEIVKIDKFIIWNAFKNTAQMDALASTIKMLHELGIKIVVEGIETNEYFNKMKEFGCQYFQGFLFARPLNEENFVTFCGDYNKGLIY